MSVASIVFSASSSCPHGEAILPIIFIERGAPVARVERMRAHHGPAVRDAEIERIGFALKAELEPGEPNGRPYVEGLGLALAARLVSRCADRRPAARPRTRVSAPQVREMTDHIQADL